VQQVVNARVRAREARAAYLSFARELYRSITRPPVPDFSLATKRVVLRWFRRGLSGHVMHLIGEALIGRMFPAGR
jgi:hypothetical protein